MRRQCPPPRAYSAPYSQKPSGRWRFRFRVRLSGKGSEGCASLARAGDVRRQHPAPAKVGLSVFIAPRGARTRSAGRVGSGWGSRRRARVADGALSSRPSPFKPCTARGGALAPSRPGEGRGSQGHCFWCAGTARHWTTAFFAAVDVVSVSDTLQVVVLQSTVH